VVHEIFRGSIDWHAVRDDFPILGEAVHGQPLIYFDNAATSQKPRAAMRSATITSTTTPTCIVACTN
jgi:selenocysteine lyase/cysteine desulfurase